MKLKFRILFVTYLLMQLALIVGCNSTQSPVQVMASNQVAELTERPEILIFDNDTLAIYKIDSSTFFDRMKSSSGIKDTLPYIADFTKAKMLLNNRVSFAGYNIGSNKLDSSLHDQFIYKIIFSSGREFSANDYENYWDVAFSRYYPTEDILLGEGGHSSDYSFDLQHGIIGPELVGNPAYINYSPNKTHRVNGWFPGQECSCYFIQSKTANGYRKYVSIPLDLTAEGFDLCTITDLYWISDQEFYFRNTFFSDESDSRLGSFKALIKK